MACELGNIQLVKTLLELGANVNFLYKQRSKFPLHYAAQKGHLEVVIFLIEHGALVDLVVENSHFIAPLYMAVQHDKLDVVRELVKRGADVNKFNMNHQCSIFAANNIPMVEELIQLGVDLELANKDSKLIISLAIDGKAHLVRHLVTKYGLDLNGSGEGGRTAIHWAAERHEKSDMVKLLIELGAEINPRTHTNFYTPLHYAVVYNQIENLKVLIEHGCDVAAVLRDGCTALHLATIDETVQILVDLAEADVASRANDQSTPLHCMCRANGAIEEIIKRGADVNARDDKLRTPLHYTLSEEGANVLLANGADIHAVDTNGMTPLHYTIKKNCLSVAEYLRKAGADTGMVDNKVKTVQ